MPQQTNNQQEQQQPGFTQSLLTRLLMPALGIGGSMVAGSQIKAKQQRNIFDEAYSGVKSKRSDKYNEVRNNILKSYDADMISEENRDKALKLLDDIDKATGSKDTDKQQSERFKRLAESIDATSNEKLKRLELNLRTAQEAQDRLNLKLKGTEDKPAKNPAEERIGRSSERVYLEDEDKYTRKGTILGQEPYVRKAEGKIRLKEKQLKKDQSETAAATAKFETASEKATSAAAAAPNIKTAADTARVQLEQKIAGLKRNILVTQQQIARARGVNQKAALNAQLQQETAELAKAEKLLASRTALPGKVQARVDKRVASAQEAGEKLTEAEKTQQKTAAALPRLERRFEAAKSSAKQTREDLIRLARDIDYDTAEQTRIKGFQEGKPISYIGTDDEGKSVKAEAVRPNLAGLKPRLPDLPTAPNAQDVLKNRLDNALKKNKIDQAQYDELIKQVNTVNTRQPLYPINDTRRIRTEAGRILDQAKPMLTDEQNRAAARRKVGTAAGIGLSVVSPLIPFVPNIARGFNAVRAPQPGSQGSAAITPPAGGPPKQMGWEEIVAQNPNLSKFTPAVRRVLGDGDKFNRLAGGNQQKALKMLRDSMTPEEHMAFKELSRRYPTTEGFSWYTEK